MRRISLFLFALFLLFSLVTSVVIGQRLAPVQPNRLIDGTVTFIHIPPPTSTPPPQPVNSPTPNLDRDGDGTPDSIDQCPDQGGPSWNGGCPVAQSPAVAQATAGVAPTIPVVVLPTMPFTGDCVLATRSDAGVNIRAEPSTSAQIVGVLNPQTLYPVIAQLNNAEGIWDRITAGWLARRVVRQGGDCTMLPEVAEPGAGSSDLAPLTLTHPDGFALTLDKGSSPGTDTPQGYCSTGFSVDAPVTNGVADKFNFAFGDGSAESCIRLNPDAQGFVLTPPDPCDAALTCNIVTHWYVGFSPDSATPILVAFLQPNPGGINPLEPDKTGVMFVWRFHPPDPCKAGGQSCPGTPTFTLNWSLTNPPDPDKPGVTINWGLSNPPEPDKPEVTINWSLINPPEPDKPEVSINWALSNPPDPDKPEVTINWSLVNPPEPDFQGFGIAGVPGASAPVAVEFAIPAVQ